MTSRVYFCKSLDLAFLKSQIVVKHDRSVRFHSFVRKPFPSKINQWLFTAITISDLNIGLISNSGIRSMIDEKCSGINSGDCKRDVTSYSIDSSFSLNCGIACVHKKFLKFFQCGFNRFLRFLESWLFCNTEIIFSKSLRLNISLT